MYNDYTVLSIGRDALVRLWANVADFLPRFVLAIFVFLVGWLLAVFIAKIVWHLIKFIQLDKGLESIGFRQVWERSGHKLDTPLFFYELVKWFVIVLALMISTEILHLDKVTELLNAVVLYLPHVFVGAIVLVIGVLVAKFVEHAVRGSVKAAQLHSANFLALTARWAVLVFALLIALDQLQIAGYIINTAVTGVIAAAALAAGLAFGLGGKEHADEILSKWRKNIQD